VAAERQRHSVAGVSCRCHQPRLRRCDATAPVSLRNVCWPGRRYRDLGLIFAAKSGTPLALNNLAGRHFNPLLDYCGLPRIRLYDLRHTHVTLMLVAGVPVHEGAARVGHASAKMTLDVQQAFSCPHTSCWRGVRRAINVPIRHRLTTKGSSQAM
jgi:integrase